MKIKYYKNFSLKYFYCLLNSESVKMEFKRGQKSNFGLGK